MKALSSEHDMTTALMQDMHRMDPARPVNVLGGNTSQIQWVAKIWERHEDRCVRELLEGSGKGSWAGYDLNVLYSYEVVKE